MNFEEMAAKLLTDLWNATNPLLMLCVAGLAILGHRSGEITARRAFWGPIIIGALWGPVVVVGHARDMGGWIRPEVLVMLMFEAAFVNGFAAAAFGRLLSVMWNKLPWGGPADPPPPPPPTEPTP